MKTFSPSSLKLACLGILALLAASCGDHTEITGSSGLSGTPEAQRRSSETFGNTRAEPSQSEHDARDRILKTSDSPGRRLEAAKDMILTMTGRDAKVIRAILGDMANRDLMANSQTSDDGEIVITISAGDLQLVEQAYSHMARVSPKEAAQLLEDFHGEIAEEVLDRWISKHPGLDENDLREFQSGLDHDKASALPWRLAREWVLEYGEAAALGYLEDISSFLPAPPADMMARMRNTIATDQ